MANKKKSKIQIRLAIKKDLGTIENLMKHSMEILGKGYYSDQQIASFCQYVCVPEPQLIEDQTFFVAQLPDKSIIGCGGWSFRNTLCAGPPPSPHGNDALDPHKDPARIRAIFVDPEIKGIGVGSLILSASEKAAREYGFQKGVLVSTLSGLAFYKSKGWSSIAPGHVTFADGVVIDVVTMEKIFSEE